MSILELKNISSAQISLKYRRDPSIKTLIDLETSFLPLESSIGQRIYHFKYNINEIPQCPHCGQNNNFIKVIHYQQTCGNKKCQSLQRTINGTLTKSTPEHKVKVKTNLEKKFGKNYKQTFTALQIEGVVKKAESLDLKSLKSCSILFLCKAYKHSKKIKDIIDLNSPNTTSKIGEKIYLFKNDIFEQQKCVCGKPKKYKNNGNYHDSCGNKKCANLYRESTVSIKYGSKNITQSHHYKDLKKTLILNKYTSITTKDTILKVSDINSYLFNCKCHICEKEYEISQHLFRQRNCIYNTISCTICNPIGSFKSSKDMDDLIEFITECYNGKILSFDRTAIHPLELDVYLPDKKIAFEFNGVYWHSELFKEDNYHINKTKKCNDIGIHLIHVWEDDWKYKKDIVKSIISSKLGLIQNKIFARKTIIKEVFNKDADLFLATNHIQGPCQSSIRLGLYLNDELVSIMTFGKPRRSVGGKSNSGMELLRFCSKINTTVIGGASKLFNHFLKTNDCKRVYSYSDLSRNTGTVYEQLGFQEFGTTPPNYYYVIDTIRRHRFGFRKDVLVKEGFDPNKTEHEIMLDRGYYRIYDCGSKKYVYER